MVNFLETNPIVLTSCFDVVNADNIDTIIERDAITLSNKPLALSLL